jgi:hypothetical protein
MGNRLHVCSAYKVEYASIEAFNYKISEFHSLLTALSVDYTGEAWDEDFEILKEDWIKGLEKLKNLDQLPEEERECINDKLKELGYELPEVIGLFEQYYNEAEPGYDWLEFSFF